MRRLVVVAVLALALVACKPHPVGGHYHPGWPGTGTYCARETWPPQPGCPTPN